MEPQDTRSEQGVRTSGSTTISTTGSRRHAMRLIRDEFEQLILVYELTGTSERDPRMLVIESGGGRAPTRLAQYPSNWRQLKDSALLALRAQDV